MMCLLATLSDPAQYYWAHQLLASALLGITMFSLGFVAGAFLWAGRKRKALALQKENEALGRQDEVGNERHERHE